MKEDLTDQVAYIFTRKKRLATDKMFVCVCVRVGEGKGLGQESVTSFLTVSYTQSINLSKNKYFKGKVYFNHNCED